MTRARRLGLILLCNTAAGAIPAALRSLYQPDADFHFFWMQFRSGSVYAYGIGTLCFVGMHFVGPRLNRLPRPLRIPVVLLTFITAAVIGSIAAPILFIAFGWIPGTYYLPTFYYGLRLAILITLVLGAVVTAFEVMSHRLQAATLELRTRQLEEASARKLATE